MPYEEEKEEERNLLLADGFVLLAERCNDDLVGKLLDVARRGEQSARAALGSKEIGIGSAAGYTEIVQRSPGRWDVPIDSEEFGIEHDAMPWWPLIESVLGADAELWLCGVIASDPGSSDQFWHSDSPHETPDHLPANAMTVLMALHDVSMDMGPTELARGSHRLTNHMNNPSLVVEQLIYQHPETSPDSLVEGTSQPPPEAWAAPLPAGSCVVFDDRVLHRGRANRSSEVRYVGYFTYRRPGYSTDKYFETDRSVHN